MQQVRFILEPAATLFSEPQQTNTADAARKRWRNRRPRFVAMVDAGGGRRDRLMKRAYSLPISTNVNKIFRKTLIAEGSLEERGRCAATTRVEIVISEIEVNSNAPGMARPVQPNRRSDVAR